MSFDGIVLYGIIHELQQSLLDGRISRIYQPSKNELSFLSFIIEGTQADCIGRFYKLQNPSFRYCKSESSSPPMFCMLSEASLGRKNINPPES